ncbi:zinc finger MYM-type protein 1-like [Hydra vulgaris]|uniref:zinc finger MYM-type protein 1-like n=1 Tax=Hydra vulgaris TaxID=6087 RepID=UPI0032E9C5B5
MISELLLKEAYLNCFDKTFSSFICLIALSNVIKQPIESIYPEIDNKIQKPIQSKLFFPTVSKNTSDIDKSSFCNKIVKTEVVISKNANNNDKKQMNLESNVPQKESNIVDISLLNTNQLASYSNYDVSSYCLQGEKLKSGTNDHELLSLINNVWVPDKCFQFPLTGKSRKRRFLLKWLDDFSWLCYSKIEDGAYCLPCTLFGTNLPNKYALCKLFKEPFNTWRAAVKVFNDHEKTVDGLHIKSMHCYNMLLSRAKNNSFPIEVSLDSSRKQRIEENKKKLESIVKTIIFLGRSDMPLRGHRDDRKYQGEIGESSKNTGLGNFIELLNFRVDAGDLILKEHLLSAPKNSTYISKTIQNKLIECCGNAVEEVLLNDIKKSKYFSIIADEASDCATIEQLSIVIRYVDLNSTSGLSIATNNLETLKEFGLDIRKCRGQSYDGAASMSGEYKGVSSVIKNKEKTELPSTISDTPKLIDMRSFSNILPITTCECERSISTFRRIKTYTRSTMSENRLNGLALMSIHQEIVPDINRVIEIFASKGDRKLERNIHSTFNGDADVLYSKSYKFVGQKAFLKNLTDKTSTLVGFDLANHILAHLTKSKNAVSVLIFDNAIQFTEKEKIEYLKEMCLALYIKGYQRMAKVGKVDLVKEHSLFYWLEKL